MECREMCEILCAYLDNELDSESTAKFEEHLRSCSNCRIELAIQRNTKLLLQNHVNSLKTPGYLRNRIQLELDRIEEYRESCIPVLDLMRWGTHVAQLYKNKDDIKDVLVPYISQGLKENELCVWVTCEMSEAEAKDAIQTNVPDLQEYLDKRQLQLFSYKDWYITDGGFQIQKALEGAVNKCHEAVSQGYSGLRATGDISWLESSDWDDFMNYESVLNNAVPNEKALIICTYNEYKCNKSNVSDVIERHKHVISKSDDVWKRRTSAD
jgi:hypothetical protein